MNTPKPAWKTRALGHELEYHVPKRHHPPKKPPVLKGQKTLLPPPIQKK